MNYYIYIYIFSFNSNNFLISLLYLFMYDIIISTLTPVQIFLSAHLECFAVSKCFTSPRPPSTYLLLKNDPQPHRV